MKLVYIAGPFRGKTNWEVKQNVRRAEKLALAVAGLGLMPVCPHKNTEEFDGLLTGEFWLDGTLEILRRCDAVILTEDWERSSGTRGEVDEAVRLGIPICKSIDSLRALKYSRGWV